MDQDQKRSVQDILPPTRRRPVSSPRMEIHDDDTPARPPRPRQRGSAIMVISAVVVVLVIGGIVFSVSNLFESATIYVTPREQDVTVEALKVSAQKDAVAPAMSFTLATKEKIGVRTVPASGTSKVEEKAHGTIVVYNTQTVAQRLIKNTRFETPDGLIFRTPNSITIPASSTKDGKSTPGSLEVEVFADEPGEKYNIALVDFTVPGFKGSPQFDQVYARSKTSMTDGFVGTKATVAKDVEEKNRGEMRTALETGLRAEALEQIPEGYFASKDLVFVSFEAQPSRSVEGGAELREKGTAYTILLPVGALAAAIADASVGDYDAEAVTLLDPSVLTISLSEASEDASAQPWAEDTLDFELSGKPHLVWVIDTAAIQADLAGKSREALNPVLQAGYPSVERARAEASPFWSNSFPSDLAKLKVVLQLSENGQN